MQTDELADKLKATGTGKAKCDLVRNAPSVEEAITQLEDRGSRRTARKAREILKAPQDPAGNGESNAGSSGGGEADAKAAEEAKAEAEAKAKAEADAKAKQNEQARDKGGDAKGKATGNAKGGKPSNAGSSGGGA